MAQRKPARPSSANRPNGGSGFIRLIAGQWRGRKLPVRDVLGLRPTTDRVKETVFNWLSPHLAGSRCLDRITSYNVCYTKLLRRPTIVPKLLFLLLLEVSTNDQRPPELNDGE